MAYGTVKVDNITFTNGGSDQTITVSGIVQSISGDITATGTLQGATIIGTSTVSGATVTGNAGQFTTATAATGIFTTQISGATVTGNVGNFTTITGGTVTLTSGVIASGTAANPSLSIVGDSNTGLYSPGADQLAISTGGTGRLFVAANGDINLLDNGLYLTKTGLGNGQITFDGSTYSIISNSSGAPLVFGTNSTERLRITSAGLVGIGTSSPGALLDAQATSGNAKIQAKEITTNKLFQIEANTAYHALYGAGAVPVYLYSNGSIAMTLDSSQRVGIGTTTVNTTLEVLNSSAPIIRVGDGIRHMELRGGSTGQNAAVGTNYAGSFDIIQNGSAAVTIDASKRVLVGTSSSRSYTSLGNPQLQLEGIAYAQSSIGLTNNQNVTDGSYIIFNKTRGTSVGSNTIVQAGDSLGAIWFQGTDGSASVLSSTIACAVEGTPAANKIASRLVFSTTADGASAPTERLRITSDGKVGIGTNSIRGTSLLDARGDISFGSNATYYGLLGYNAGTGHVECTSSDGAFKWIRASGAATSMVLDSSGRLLVGTSSSLSTGNGQFAKLQIVGNTFNASNDAIFALVRGEAASSITSGEDIASIGFTDNAGGTFASISCSADANAGTSDYPGRLVFSTTADGASSPTERMRIGQDGSVSIYSGGFARFKVSGNAFFDTQNGIGIAFGTNAILPTDQTGTLTDNTKNIGVAGNRWATIYAGTGTINTSDANLKQDIDDLDPTELSVAAAIKGLIKKFRFTDAVAAKGDDARIHVGVIAQEVEQAFVDEGLDPRRYALFCEDTLEDGSKRLGIRYDELLAFVIAAL